MGKLKDMEKSQTINFNIVDADDFHQKNNGFELFKHIRNTIPDFKINLFCVVGLCKKAFINDCKKMEWLDLIPHGWKHPGPLECLSWSYQESIKYLDKIESLGLTKGFKAPGWQISNGMYQALLERGYWVADQEYNNNRRHKELKTYIIDKPNKYHYHIQNVCGNGIEEKLDEILSLKGDFKFIKEII